VILLTLTPAISTATPTPAAPQVLKGSRPNVEHPHIRAAIGELREARQELEIAEHDFGGHRKEAIASVDVAIRQLQQALQYDKR
jgi:transcription elongation GreA/GreB family factor